MKVKSFSEEQFKEMLMLREAGWTLNALADLYHVDFSTIYYHSKRNCIILSQEFSIPFIVRLVIQKQPLVKAKPLCYQDYLKEYKKRNEANRSNRLEKIPQR